jgi:hypothetical protein
MKKLFVLSLVLIFATSASATVYKWVDERGVTNFVDDYGKVPFQHQGDVEKVTMPKLALSSPPAPYGMPPMDPRSGDQAKQPPPIEQTLVREGDFAMKLAESLKIGKPASEAEAENLLAMAGIAPKNGWIADYPITPDIIGELAESVGDAADARKLPMGREEALKAVRTAAAELELPVIAEVPDGYSEGPYPPPDGSYPTAPEYPGMPYPEDYYYADGPPVITYYLPPPDYTYLYAWVPFPFWCSGYYFPGYYMLHDFHRRVHNGHDGHGHGHGDGHPHYVTNHFRDHQGRMATVDPARRREGRTLGMREASPRGFSSKEAGNSARSIYERSRDRAGSKTPSAQMPGRENRTPGFWQNRRGNERQAYSRQASPPSSGNRSRVRPPAYDGRINRAPGQTGIPRAFSRPQTMNRQNWSGAQRPFTSQNYSFRSPSSPGRSFSLPQGGGQHFNSSPRSGGSFGSHQGGGGFSGGHQGGGGGGGGFGRGGAFR